MSLVNPKPAGWAVNDVLSSAQLNLFGQQIAKALDKSAAGDVLNGQISMNSGSAINSGFAVQITTSAIAGIQGQFAGAISLGGGANDYPAFHTAGTSTAAPRTRSTWVAGDTCSGISFNLFSPAPATVTLGATGQPVVVDGIHGGGPAIQTGGFTTIIVSTANPYMYYLPIPKGALHNGATLASASLFLTGANAHTALPTSQPAFGIFEQTSGGSVAALLSGVGYVQDAQATVAAYKLNHNFSLTPNQHTTIDVTATNYFAVIWDESGAAGTQVGNLFCGVQLNFSNILNMAFP